MYRNLICKIESSMNATYTSKISYTNNKTGNVAARLEDAILQ